MKRPDIDEIYARAKAASDGPWHFTRERKDGTSQVYKPSLGPMRMIVPVAETTQRDAPFIAHAREDVPALCAYALHLEAEIERWRREAK